MHMIQVQKWLFGTRILIVDGNSRGSVMLEIPQDKSKMGGADVWLYSLWVDRKYRKQGVARSLMELAESYAKHKGYKKIALEWDNREAPRWVKVWYEKRGYETSAFGRHNCLMIKKLAQCQPQPTEKDLIS